MDIAQIDLKRYLLGDLDESEAERIGVAIIADDALDASLRLAEHDLMEDHLEGALTPRETELFFDNFMVSRERAIELESIRLVRARARKARPSETPSGAKNPGHERRKWGLFAPPGPLRPYWIGLAVAGLVLVVFFVALVYTPVRPGDDGGLAALNARDLGDLSRFVDVPKVTLTSGTYRGSGTPQIATTGANSNVMLRLILPSGWGPEGSYLAELATRDGKVLPVGDVGAYSIGAVYEVRILVPVSTLGKGEHKVKVTRPGVDGGSAEYRFEII